jgi:hypothetical protein
MRSWLCIIYDGSYSKRDWTRRAIARMRWRMVNGLLILSAVVMVVGVGLVLLVRYIIRA